MKNPEEQKAGSRCHLEYHGRGSGRVREPGKRSPGRGNCQGIEKPRDQESTQLRSVTEETGKQPTGHRERDRVQGRREGSRAPTQPQATEKTTNQNLAECRGESQEEQRMPRTNQKNGLEVRPAMQKSRTPPGRWE